MHYYKFNIGDYASHTRHLSLMEDLAYRRLLDLAYTSEKPLSKDTHSLARLIGMRDYQSEIEDVLKEFFEEVEEGWIHGRVLKEIEESGGRSDKAKIAARARWENKRNANSMQSHCSVDATSINKDAPSIKNDATQDPLPITQDPLPIENITAISKADCPHSEIINLYHEILPTCPQIRDWTPARRDALRARWNESRDRQNLDYWRSLFEYIAGIPFLVGKVTTNGRRPFFVTLPWMLKPENFAKIREGFYEH